MSNVVKTARLDFATTTTTDATLFGRDAEIAELKDAFGRVARTRRSEAVLLAGYSGSGKSTLVNTALNTKSTTENFGIFASGKYNKIGSSQPYSAIVDAFSSICKSIESGDRAATIQHELKQSLDANSVIILSKTLPKILPLLEDTIMQSERTSVQLQWTFERLKRAFRDFLRVLAKLSMTVVLFIDDLQWADVSSLELLTFILSDKDTEGLLFLGAYRNNEVDQSHPLSIQMRRLKKNSATSVFPSVTEIEVGNLGVDAINGLLAEVTGSLLSHTRPLAQLVHKKTEGNVFFAIRFLIMLQEEGMLYMSTKTYRWEWNIDRIEGETDISDNVVDLVAKEIKRLPRHVQDMLRIASCLGTHFDLTVVSMLLDDDSHEEGIGESLATAAVQAAIKGGFVTYRKDSTTYKFTHDRIQQAAYSLIPDQTEKEKLHVRLGRLLMHMYSNKEKRKDWMLLVFVDQLNRGSTFIPDQRDRIRLATFNLLAAEKVTAQSAFFPALEYIKAGLSLLDKTRGWTEHYQLQLDLCNMYVELTFCTGDFDTCLEYVELILRNARTVRDKLRAFVAKVDALGTQERLLEAIESGFDILRDLGVKLPKRPNQAHVAVNLVRCAIKCRGKTDEEFLALPELMDEEKLVALKIMSNLITYTWFACRPDDTAVLCLRMLMISLQHGINKYSAYSFGMFGFLHGVLMDFKSAYRYGMLARSLSKRFQARDCDCRAAIVIHTMLHHIRRPMHESLDALLEAYQYGMETGDIHHSGVAAAAYSVMYFFCGLPLGPFLDDSAAFSKQMTRYSQGISFSPVLVYRQGALNLMGRCDNPVILTGEAMNEEEFLRDEKIVNVVGTLQTFWTVANQLAYYFDDVDYAGEMAEKMWQRSRDNDGTQFYVPTNFMFFALTALELSKRTGKRAFRRQARKQTKGLEGWVKRDALNTQHKLILVYAERATQTEIDPEKVKSMFDEAIVASSRSGFTQDAALANERAGRYFVERNDSCLASSYLARSQELYGEWGAVGKVEHIRKTYSFLASENSGNMRSSNFRGRRRFSSQPSQQHVKFNPFGRKESGELPREESTELQR